MMWTHRRSTIGSHQRRHYFVTNPPLIVISLEGLATSALGCYGSSWNQTPAIDRLASGGCVWDRFLATSDRPSDVLGEWIHGQANWASRLRKSLGPIELITDSGSEELQQTCFDEVLVLPSEPPSPDSVPAEDIVDTQFGQLVAAAIERDASEKRWGVLWLHSRFLTRCWDAPRELVLRDDEAAQVFLDEEELDDDLGADEPTMASPIGSPPPSYFPSTIPPEIELSKTSHPDLVTAWMRTYGCQIRLVDLLLDILVQSVEAKNPSVLLVATSGFRLGQGGRIGHRQGPLRSPDIRLPLIVNRGGPLHIPHLTSSARLSSVLEQLSDREPSICPPSVWCGQSNETQPIEIVSDRARFATSNASWFYVEDSDQSEHLFLKPDDVDDFNDVARRRGDVVEMLGPEKKNGPTNH